MGNLYISGNETRLVTKLLQKAGLKVACSTKHTLGRLLIQHPLKQDQYESNVVYQLACIDCGKHYIGQTDRPNHTQFKRAYSRLPNWSSKISICQTPSGKSPLITPHGEQLNNSPSPKKKEGC